MTGKKKTIFEACDENALGYTLVVDGEHATVENEGAPSVRLTAQLAVQLIGDLKYFIAQAKAKNVRKGVRKKAAGDAKSEAVS